MKGDALPEDDHILRYIKPSMVNDDGSASGVAFKLRTNHPGEIGLSVNWLEVLGQDGIRQLNEARRLSRLELRTNGRFAQMNVGAVKQKVAEELETIGIIHAPLEAADGYEPDPSHAEIQGLPPGNTDQAILVGDLIAECVVAMHFARVAENIRGPEQNQ